MDTEPEGHEYLLGLGTLGLPTGHEAQWRADTGHRLRRRNPDNELEGDASPELFSGLACRTDTWYDMFGGPPMGWREMVVGAAFAETLANQPDVVFLVNHEGLQMARTISDTLTVGVNTAGLTMDARCDPWSPRVYEVASGIYRGDITEMSFAFRIVTQEWDEEYTSRRILKVDLERGDVSVVTFGANPFTDIHRRHATRLEGLRSQSGDAAAAAEAAGQQARTARKRDKIARSRLGRAYAERR